MIAFDKDKAYMEVLCAFRKLVDTEYSNGGWLPPVREMCRRFGVSNVTYTKATKRLVAESIARSFPGKGIYITAKRNRPKKIGLVIGNGEESPFLLSTKTIQDIFQTAEDRGYCLHQIQGNGLNLARSAISHYVDGVVWMPSFNPDIQNIKTIYENRLFPLICVQVYHPLGDHEVFPENLPHVSEEYSTMGARLAEPFLMRGHKKLACLNIPFWRAKFVGFEAVLRNSGLVFDEDCCLEDCAQNPGKLTKMILKQKITGLVIHGAPVHVEAVFKELSTLPEEAQPEVLVWDHPKLPELCKMYPAMKIIAVVQEQNKFGKVAVNMLLDNLDTPENITSVKVKGFQVVIRTN